MTEPPKPPVRTRDELAELRARLAAQGETLLELRKLLDTTPDALIVIGEAGEIVLVNQQAERLFGYSRGELIGSSIERLLPERFRQVHQQHRRHFGANPHMRPMGAGLDLRGLTREGREIPVEISLSPISLRGRRLFASAIRDVTPRVEIEKRLREAREAADRALESKARFVAAASHDLRQPLQAASIYLDLAANGALDREQRDEAVAKTRRCVETLAELLDKIMHVSKLDSGAAKPQRRDFRLAALFDRVRDQHAPAARQKGLELRVAPSRAIVRSDPVLLQQMVENLVSNAVRYTERGGVLLGCRRRGRDLAIQVWDTGVGIAAGDHERIFEEFRRLGGRGVDSNLGMGLGLAIVRRLERLLDHPLRLRSRPGRGSVFEIRVPRGEVASVADDQPGERGTGERQGVIAVLEDDPEVLIAITTVLEVAGHTVVAATSFEGLQAELSRRDRVPDLVLTDHNLGLEVSGLEAIRALRGAYGGELPAVVLTGDSSYSFLEAKAAELDFTLLAKPVDTRRLLAELEGRLPGTRSAP